MAGSFVSRRLSEFVGVAFFALALMWLISLASYNPADPVLFFTTGPGRRAAQLRRPGRRLHGRAVVSAARLRGLPAPSRARRERLALLLVPCSRRGLHEARRRRSALRLCRRRFCRSRSERLRVANREIARRRLPREAAGLVPGGVPQQDRVDHPDPDAALPVDRPLDAVLVRPALRRALPGGSRSVGGRARRHARPPGGTSSRAPAAGGAEEAPRQVGRKTRTRTGTVETTSALPCRRGRRSRRQSPPRPTKRRSPRAPRPWSAPPRRRFARPRRGRRRRRSSARQRRRWSRRCRCRTPRNCRRRKRRIGSAAPTRSRRSRCSTRPEANRKSTSGS